MTKAQQSAYEKALAQAVFDSIEIAGKGTIKATGQKFYAVTSSDGDTCYAVIVAGALLRCNCKAGKRGGYCKHRAKVRCEMEKEAAQKAAQVSLDGQQEADRVQYEATYGHDVFAEQEEPQERIIMRNPPVMSIYRS